MVAKFKNEDYSYMQQAFSLALKGWGQVAPNPMVGAVLVKNNHVVGKGFHRRYGSPHAEVEAIRDARGEAEVSTLYLNLEPCNHQGKTPPCTQAILQSGIKKVVCSNRDINRTVKRSGFRILRKQGIEVQTGLMRKQGYRLNEIYFKHISAGKPFITLKAALSLDGYIYSGEFENRYLSGKPFLKFVHHLRAGYDAIL
ncbi:MAG: bifunctional diaminohydroxyphosphoribosylaminopyrimidine deaminase/5-amino-6-(5-phosphoribosylamino)uracil reductase RibD, partial [candidate division Zixibacteria bacterium]|nr:bifunctional diaminohydroxyphosphoribosylaminopyrimidine deaminase/5-amino-6-(5-phosphoribosylamino)uracil reductase RibD [candidate division Zixibacteria bacterium]